MTQYAELEIALRRLDVTESYEVELRLDLPNKEVQDQLESEVPIQFDHEALRQHHLDPIRYGQLLSDSLFADPKLRTKFSEAFSKAQTSDPPLPLRVSLQIGATAIELHSLRWETLWDPRPEGANALSTSENIVFSRYLKNWNWRDIRRRPKAGLRALVVVANPKNIEQYRLASINVEAELKRAQTGLPNIAVVPLAEQGQVTLDNIAGHLRDGYDIVYLVCHGKLVENQPHLYLENKDGETDVVPGRKLVNKLNDLQELPRLVVLASCQSGGSGEELRSGDTNVLTALGPRLAEAGVPAVLAMHGNITVGTIEEFMPVFFTELRRDGQVDRAVAVARGVVDQKRNDWWTPVLYLRLKSGRLWYTPSFAKAKGGLEEEQWSVLLGNIRRKDCTPILGPGLYESLLGSRRDIARLWSKVYQFPMAPQDRENLVQVAQFRAIRGGRKSTLKELMEYLHTKLLELYGNDLPKELHRTELDELISNVGAMRRKDDPTDAYRVLAELKLPLYITTNPSSLLETALIEAGNEPKTEYCRWNEYIKYSPSIFDDDPGYRPSPKLPLVYHVFGKFDELDSLVLTEDDYFDYLIGTREEAIPRIVGKRLVDSALLFLGFRMEDWDFRVLLRSIVRLEGRTQRYAYTHIAVQLDPEEERILEPARARRYLERYLESEHIDIFWGSAEDFIKELKAQMDQPGAGIL